MNLKGIGASRGIAIAKVFELKDYDIKIEKKSVSDLTKEERIEACYQHCCLAYADNETMNNQSVRERFGLNKSQGTIASHIIADTVAKGLIKSSNPDSDSSKFVSYVPFYA